MKVDKKKVQLLLAKQCKTMRELSVEAGFSRNWLYMFFSENREKLPKTAGKLAAALGVDVEEIIEQTDGRD
jgi:lambda repressor-like predicted transcriptional regulator